MKKLRITPVYRERRKEGPSLARVLSTTVISGNSSNKESYHKFLKSSHWQALRRKKFRKHGSCFICLVRENLHVHHNGYANTYKARMVTALKDTYTLCGGCHQAVHKVQKERNKKWHETEPIIHELRKEARAAKKEKSRGFEEFTEMIKNIT